MEKYDIFVCCGGKCGGTTLANTFHENGYKTVHVHSSKHLGNFKSDIDLANDNLYKVIDYSKEKNKIYIIDSYRTQIERKISCFFQKIHIYIPNYKNVTIENLIDYFNKRISKKNDIKLKKFSNKAIEYMKDYSWPGNIRQLKNIIERLNIMLPSDEITMDNLKKHLDEDSIKGISDEITKNMKNIN